MPRMTNSTSSKRHSLNLPSKNTSSISNSKVMSIKLHSIITHYSLFTTKITPFLYINSIITLTNYMTCSHSSKIYNHILILITNSLSFPQMHNTFYMIRRITIIIKTGIFCQYNCKFKKKIIKINCKNCQELKDKQIYVNLLLVVKIQQLFHKIKIFLSGIPIISRQSKLFRIHTTFQT